MCCILKHNSLAMAVEVKLLLSLSSLSRRVYSHELLNGWKLESIFRGLYCPDRRFRKLTMHRSCRFSPKHVVTFPCSLSWGRHVHGLLFVCKKCACSSFLANKLTTVKSNTFTQESTETGFDLRCNTKTNNNKTYLSTCFCRQRYEEILENKVLTLCRGLHFGTCCFRTQQAKRIKFNRKLSP